MNFTKRHSNKVNFPSQLGPVPDWHWPNSHSSKNSMIFQNLSKSIQIKILPQLIEKRAIIVSKDDTSESRQRATRAPSSPTLAVQIWAFPASQRLNPLLKKHGIVKQEIFFIFMLTGAGWQSLQSREVSRAPGWQRW